MHLDTASIMACCASCPPLLPRASAPNNTWAARPGVCHSKMHPSQGNLLLHVVQAMWCRHRSGADISGCIFW
jgi:hypothetical protein